MLFYLQGSIKNFLCMEESNSENDESVIASPLQLCFTNFDHQQHP